MALLPASYLKGLWVSDACQHHAACDGQVKGVVGSLVRHDPHVVVKGVLVQVNLSTRGSSDEVQELAVRGLEGGLQVEMHFWHIFSDSSFICSVPGV